MPLSGAPGEATRRGVAPWAGVSLWIAGVAVVAALTPHFWIPLDDGTLAQSAERVLAGQLPHRDFGDPYTGLNAMVGAAAFRLFGVELGSLRIPLVAGFALWVPALWLVCRSLAAPAAALAATAVAAAISVLAYPAAMPTWFGLFAATWGLAALLAWVKVGSDRRRLLVLAGAAGGVSVLFKVTGLYFVAAALLTIAWRRRAAPRGLIVAGCGAFLLLLGRLILSHAGGGGAAATVHFLLPSLALVVLVVARSLHASMRTDARPLLADTAALAAGVVLPVALFLVPYAASGSVGAWMHGVFLAPGRRFEAAASGAGSWWTVAPGLAAVVLLVAARRLGPRAGRVLGLLAATLVAVALAADDVLDGAAIGALWHGVRGFLPWLVVAGAWEISRATGPGTSTRAAAAVAVLATAALWSLVQFPYPAPAYFFYVAPFLPPAVLAFLSLPTRAEGAPTAGSTAPLLAVLTGVYLFLGAGYISGVVTAGTAELPGRGAGVRIPAEDARVYRRVMQAVQTAAGQGTLWAGPDAPEIYFLTARPNPTRVIYEFLEGVPPDAAAARRADVVVLQTRPLFSRAWPPEAVSDLLAAGFRETDRTGSFRIFARSGP